MYRSLTELVEAGVLIPAPVADGTQQDASRWLQQAMARISDAAAARQFEAYTLLDVLLDQCVLSCLALAACDGYRLQQDKRGFTKHALEAAAAALRLDETAFADLLALADVRATKYLADATLAEADIEFALATARNLLDKAIVRVGLQRAA